MVSQKRSYIRADNFVHMVLLVHIFIVHVVMFVVHTVKLVHIVIFVVHNDFCRAHCQANSKVWRANSRASRAHSHSLRTQS